MAESALSGVGQVADAMRRAREIAEAAIAEAKSVHSIVESEVASLMARTNASTTHAVEVLSGQVQEVAAHSKAQTSRVAEAVTWQLESEIQAAVTSTAVTAELNTRAAVEGMRQDVKAQLEQNRVDAQHRDEEAHHKVDEIAVELANLTK